MQWQCFSIHTQKCAQNAGLWVMPETSLRMACAISAMSEAGSRGSAYLMAHERLACSSGYWITRPSSSSSDKGRYKESWRPRRTQHNQSYGCHFGNFVRKPLFYHDSRCNMRKPILDDRCHGCGTLLEDCGLYWIDQAPQDESGRLYCSPACVVESVLPVLYPSLHNLCSIEV